MYDIIIICNFFERIRGIMKFLKLFLFLIFASMLMLFTFLPISIIASEAPSKAKKVETDQVRVQFLSNTVVRVEAKAGGKFEDRDTLIIVGRDDFEGVEADLSYNGDEITATTSKYKVTIQKNTALSKGAVKIYTLSGELLWDYSKGTEGFYTELPTPADKPQVYAIADSPRVIEPATGMVYKGSTAITSGYIPNNADDFYIFMPEGDAKVLRSDFVRLTGRSEISDIKTFGSWYSRYQAWSDKEMLNIIDTYRKNGLPIDVLVVDTDWRVGASTGYNVNTTLFPDMKSYISQAFDKGVLTIFNDHTRNSAYQMLSPTELKYHTENLQYHITQNGLHGWWYDRNWNYSLKSPYSKIQFYTLGQVMYHDIIDDANGNSRVFLLSNLDWVRNGTLEQGPSLIGHRYGIQWTGDITSEALQLREEIELLVHGSAVGSNPYISSDLGGHKRAKEQTQYMYARWLQFGALSPVFRIHSYGAEAPSITKLPYDRRYMNVSESIKTYLNMRYNLLPHFYSLAHENYETGLPLARRLDFYYPQYEESTDETQYLLGEDIIVAPLWSHYGEGDDIVPNNWFDSKVTTKFFNNTLMAGTPVYTSTADRIEFDWGDGSPKDGKVNKDNFSAVFESKITPTEDCYIGVVSDDGARVYINGTLYVDNWKSSWLESQVGSSEEKVLKAGQTYNIKVEYYDDQYGAICKLVYQRKTEAGEASRDVFIPDGKWVDVFTGTVYEGPQTVRSTHTINTSPIFVRLGGIIPTTAVASPIPGADYEKLSLNVYAGGDGTYTLSEDDGESEDYQNGAVRKTTFTHTANESGGVIDISAASGNFTTSYSDRIWTVRVHSEQKIYSATVGGNAVEVKEIAKSEEAKPFTETGASPDMNVYEITFTAPMADAQSVVYSFTELASDGTDDSKSSIGTGLLIGAAVAATAIVGAVVAVVLAKKKGKEKTQPEEK